MRNKELTIGDIITIWTKYPCKYRRNRDSIVSQFVCELGEPWCNIHSCPLVFNYETNRFEKQKTNVTHDYNRIVFMKTEFKEDGEHHFLSHESINIESDEEKYYLDNIGFFDANETFKLKFLDRGGDVLIRDVIVLDGLSRKCYFDRMLLSGYKNHTNLINRIKKCLNNKEFKFLVFESVKV